MIGTPQTCGPIVCSPRGWLLAHVTGSAHWDLPKGKAEPGERPVETALRECREETGLDFRSQQHALEPLGTRTYHRKRGKILTLFRLNLETAFDLSVCTCTHLVHTRGPEPVPEMDAFAWVPWSEVADRVNARMARHLRRRGLLPQKADQRGAGAGTFARGFGLTRGGRKRKVNAQSHQGKPCPWPLS